MNIGVVGGGEGATKAISALVDCKKIRIGAVVCKDNELTGLIDTSLRVSMDELIHRSDINAIYIATPNNTHIDLAKEFIISGKHIMIEKPLAISFNDASRLISFNSDKTIIAVAFKKRYGDGIQYIKKQLDVYKHHINVNVKWHNPFPYSNWRCNREISGGGIVMDLGSHILDLLEFLLGKIVELEVKLEASKSFSNIEKAASIKLKFENEHMALIDLNWNQKKNCQKYSFYFSNKRFHLQRQNNGIDIGIFESEKDTHKILFHTASEYIGLFNAWRESILKKEINVPNFEDGLKNQSIIQVIYTVHFNEIYRLSYNQENYYAISN